MCVCRQKRKHDRMRKTFCFLSLNTLSPLSPRPFVKTTRREGGAHKTLTTTNPAL